MVGLGDGDGDSDGDGGVLVLTAVQNIGQIGVSQAHSGMNV